MVILIGLVTMSALVFVLVWSLTGESDAERRHKAGQVRQPASLGGSDPEISFKQAA